MTRTSRLAAATAVTLLGLSALSACGSSSAASSSASASSSSSKSSAMSSMSMSPSPGGSASTSVTLMIMDYEFSGAGTVRPGARITVVNHDSVAHTVTADRGGAFDVKVAPGESATLTAPRKAGSYPYHCTYHAEMHGTLTVG